MTSRTVADFWKSLWFAGGNPKSNAQVQKRKKGSGLAQHCVCPGSHTVGGRYALPSSAASSAIRIYIPLRICRK